MPHAPTLLSINNYYYRRGGAEVVFLEHNELFARLGWDVVPFCSHHAQNLASRWSDYFVRDIEFGSEYSLLEKMTRIPKVIYSLEARRKLRDLLRQVRPTIAHAHNVYHHISPSIFGLLHERDIPVVVTLHDLKIACPAYKMMNHGQICERCKNGNLVNVVVNRCIKNSFALSSVVALEAVLHRVMGTYARYVNRFVVPSRFYLEKLTEWGWPKQQFVYVPNCIAPGDFLPDAMVGRAFIYAGRLGPEKGLQTLVRAAAVAKQPIVIAGTGPEEVHLKSFAQQVGADVTFLGYLTGVRLQTAMKQARAFVLASEWYENAPVSVLEAYALGRPVIGAAIGGIPELIQEGITGFTFASGNVTELAAMLARVAAMPDHVVAEMGMAGRRWVESSFTPERYRDRMLRLYGEVSAGDCVKISQSEQHLLEGN